jgi:hypothetical protein
MPRPVEPREVELWIWMMQLSDEQAQLLWRFYDQYVPNESATHDRFVQPLWDRSAELRSQFVRQPAPVPIALEYARLFDQDRQAAIAKIAACESLIFDQIELVLADSQKPLVTRARAERARTRFARSTCWYPAGDIDIADLLHQLHSEGVDVAPLNVAEFDAVLSTYDTHITSLRLRSSPPSIRSVVRLS